ncbi:MAG: hypothetical protein KH083_10230 [Intestinibacter bartlettii]|uniref:hypothetical protein n=1 Tax=Intestinibacter bartlettii TaxID=261299 RepID=UPI00242B7E28|nr:hypothetical protein [Intestinibacter bartlettii]MBS7148772.1 hypothetical protein [Intestinibacter bartlettii]
MRDDLIKNCYISSFDIEDSSLKHLMIIGTKCLIDNKLQRNVYVDNNRLKDELIYFNFYESKPQYSDVLNVLLPLILSNTNIQKSEEEVLALIQKYVRYLKKEQYLFDYILASVLYNSLIHNLIDNKDMEYEEILQSIKEKVIGLQIELDKTSIIKFQMARIKAIQVIDNYIDLKICDYEENEIITNLLNVIYDIYMEDREVINDGLLSIKKSILSILSADANLNIDNIDFISSMAMYITKLRKYSINKSSYNTSSDPRSLINLNKGDTIVDPILNKIQVISKDFCDNVLRISIKSKSGQYTFSFKRV